MIARQCLVMALSAVELSNQIRIDMTVIKSSVIFLLLKTLK